MDLTEAEIQILASLAVLKARSREGSLDALEERGDEYSIYKEDWSGAFESLIQKGLITATANGFLATDTGHPIGELYRAERPDMYWYHYQRLYTAGLASEAHSELCRRVFGADLCQDGQTDMDALEHLMELLGLKAGDKVLDLGCGAGVIAEYLSDVTGAEVIGLDFSQTAIDAANDRTAYKRAQMRFLVGNFNALDFEGVSFDAVVSLDTLYWAADLTTVVAKLLRILKPKGRMGIFMNHHIGPTDPPNMLNVEHSSLAVSLSQLGKDFETHNYTKEIGEFWKRNCEAAEELLPRYTEEGNAFIGENLIRESKEEYLPDIKAKRIARYLYFVQKS